MGMVEAMLDKVWATLKLATTSRSSFNFLQFAIVGIIGCPQLRTIDLRQ
jgi:hypothetical protein